MRGTSRDLHSNGVLMGRTFALLHFEDAPLDGRAPVEVPYTSAPGAVHGVAGSGARLGVWASDITKPSAARGMLKKKNVKVLTCDWTSIDKTDNTRFVSGVDGGNQVAIVTTASALHRTRGGRVDADGLSTRTRGIPRWGTNVSGASTTSRSEFLFQEY